MSKSSKISNYILLISFFIIITFPGILSNIFGLGNTIDESEKRELAEKPKLTFENLETYSSDFDKYYNDHLPFRSAIRTGWTNFNFLLLNESTNSQVLIGKNDGSKSSTWLFYQNETDGNPVLEAQGNIDFSEEQIQNFTKIIKEKTEEYSNINIQTYFAIIPNKENIYKDKLPDKIKIYSEETRVDKVVKYLEEDCSIENIIYPKKELNEGKKTTLTYYKQDTHWNDYGAFIGFEEIFKKINTTYEKLDYNIKVPGEQIIYNDLTNLMGVKNIMKDVVPEIEFLPDKKYSTIKDNDNIVTVCEDAEIDKTLMIVGDSFMEYMIPYFSKVYSKVIYINRMNYGKYILYSYKPDIFICEFAERYLDHLFQLEL